MHNQKFNESISFLQKTSMSNEPKHAPIQNQIDEDTPRPYNNGGIQVPGKLRGVLIDRLLAAVIGRYLGADGSDKKHKATPSESSTRLRPGSTTSQLPAALHPDQTPNHHDVNLHISSESSQERCTSSAGPEMSTTKIPFDNGNHSQQHSSHDERLVNESSTSTLESNPSVDPSQAASHSPSVVENRIAESPANISRANTLVDDLLQPENVEGKEVVLYQKLPSDVNLNLETTDTNGKPNEITPEDLKSNTNLKTSLAGSEPKTESKTKTPQANNAPILNTYKKVYAKDNAKQHNGNVGSFVVQNDYTDCVASDNAKQVNGNIDIEAFSAANFWN